MSLLLTPSKLLTSFICTCLVPKLILLLNKYLLDKLFKKLSLVFLIILVELTKNKKFR